MGSSQQRTGQIAVIFTAQRNGADEAGYAAAAEAMVALAAQQPGYAGIESVRDAQGLGITVSYWRDDAAAIAWRDHPDHARIRELGRALWYDWYDLQVSRVERGYGWRRP
jgi:heme-degrading monooxygenase HmoA